MKLLVQGDDFGLTYGITDGICLAAQFGILTCTGLMTNLESSAYAARRIQEFPHISVGQDINFFAGKPVSSPEQVPHLVDERGFFLSSEERKKSGDFPRRDPFPYEETIFEVRNQVRRFIELMGRKPDYIQGHSYLTASLNRAIREMAEEYKIPCTMDVWQTMKMYRCDWLAKDHFTKEVQESIDVEQGVYDQLEELSQNDRAFIVCHPGYLDQSLFERSTYTAIRYKHLQMLISERIKEKLKDLSVELVHYKDLI